ncbi:EAL domain-containing protein, partial [Klebsiella pneumoniae]
LAIVPLSEGFETVDEHASLKDLGVSLTQGYVLAKPNFETLTVTVAPTTLLPQVA